MSESRQIKSTSASPALAGMDLLGVIRPADFSGFPRARGDGPAARLIPIRRAALPPRSRGWTRATRHRSSRNRASPALAGMDPLGDRAPKIHRRFPRARGDGPALEFGGVPCRVLPPRSRGWTSACRISAKATPASPALAGMDPWLHGCWRWRGRFPRARGDGPLEAILGQERDALPPRSRGWTSHLPYHHPCPMASPALAGMDPLRLPLQAPVRSFPRARGDGPGIENG